MLFRSGARAIQIRSGQNRHLLLLRTSEKPAELRAYGLETDGEAAAVELTADGTLQRAMAVKATRVTLNGQRLWTSPRPADWSR